MVDLPGHRTVSDDPRWDEVDGHLRDREGQPISLRRFVEISSDEALRHVAYEVVRGPAGPTYVSTIWTGVDMNLLSLFGGPALIFETMVFDPHGDPLHDYSRRWPTLELAQRGHRVIADRIAQGWWINLGGLA